MTTIHPISIIRWLIFLNLRTKRGLQQNGGAGREGAVVGIGAIVLEGAEVGRHTVAGGRSLVPPRMKIPNDSLVHGIPLKMVRTLMTKIERDQRASWRRFMRNRGII